VYDITAVICSVSSLCPLAGTCRNLGTVFVVELGLYRAQYTAGPASVTGSRLHSRGRDPLLDVCKPEKRSSTVLATQTAFEFIDFVTTS
jgi:hypothetical protein